ncbi:MAG: hypothetical protein WCL18_10640 [bacterium]
MKERIELCYDKLITLAEKKIDQYIENNQYEIKDLERTYELLKKIKKEKDENIRV